MYVPPAFKTDEATALAFAAKRGFGTFIAVDQGQPVAAHLPFEVTTVDGVTRAIFHVARANPLHQIIGRAPDVLLTVLGADHYISPDWYVMEDQVPTWNYASVHLSGTAKVVDAAGMLAFVDSLSAAFEARLLPKKPWTSGKMTPAKREAMLRAIVGIEMTVTKVEASFKLGQHKQPADQAGVIANLEKLGTLPSQDYLEMWKAWRASKA